MTAPECATGCGRPSPSAVICGTCTASLRATLELAAAIEPDLLDAVARQLHHGSGGKTPAAEPPLPYDPAASDAAEALHRCLSGWISVIAMVPPPAGSIRGMAAWLNARMQHVSHHELAADILSSVRHAVDRCVRVLDAPPERHPAGDCSCGRPLLADAHADEARCACGEVTTGIMASRAERAAAADVLGSADAISGALAGIGIRVSGGTIRQLITRGRLARRPDGQLAMSEVLAWVAERDARRAG